MLLAPRVGHSPRWYQGPLLHCFPPLWASSPIASARAYIPPSAFHSRRSFLAGRVRDRLAFSPRIWQWCPLLLRPHLLSWRDLFPETFLRLSFPSRSLAQANFLQSVTGDVRPPGRSQLGRLPCLFLTFSAMKFTKKYQTYMDGMEAELPGVGLKRLKKMLKKCRSELRSHREAGDDDSGCPGHCSVCDGSFFPCLLDQMSAVVGSFNEKAKKLLQLHLASGFKRYVLWFTSKGDRSHGTLIKQGKDLVTYAIINAVAMRKILKKYDKIHYSKQGQAFKAQAQSLHIEILQSPWLCELMAFYMNLRRSKNKAAIELFSDCSLIFDDDRPTLTCNLFDSMRVDISLTCSICLDTVFDPVSLSCGHIFCYLCCCSAASVTIVDGLKSADHKAKCPLCRQEGVFPNAVHLDELNMLLSHSCPEYWERRLQLERVERVRLAKEHWESQCRAFLGIE